MKKPIKLYWSTSLKNDRKNFGDWLSPVLCEAISKRSIVWASPKKCDLTAVGSVLRKFKKHYFQRRVHVWGSGQIEKGKAYKSPHYYHALRGKYSAEQILNHKIKIYGDPALLCPILIEPRLKKYEIGIIPHYKDQKNALITTFKNKHKSIKIINIFSETRSFIEEITECKIILSSSLHGLIVADAFSIPNCWIQISDLVRGNGFKFYDYYSAFKMENISPFPFDYDTSINDIEKMASIYARPDLEKIKKELLNSFPTI